MPKITLEKATAAFDRKCRRLGLEPLVSRVRSALVCFPIALCERSDSNDTGALWDMIRICCVEDGAHIEQSIPGFDWAVNHTVGNATLCLGVKFGLAPLGEMFSTDILAMKRAVTRGATDAGLVLLPDVALQRFLTGRTPTVPEALKHIALWEADDFPIGFFGLRHDVPGGRLEKGSAELLRGR
jgi:hypothetical protein